MPAAELEQWWRESPPVSPLRPSEDAIRYREDTVERLRELGYLE